MSNTKFNVKYCVLLPIVLIVTIFLWCCPASFFGSLGDVLTVTQQRTIAIFAFAALMWIFEIVPNWVTSLMVIVISLLTISSKSIGFLMTKAIDPATGSAILDAAGKPTFAEGAFVPYTELMRSFADPVVMLFLGGFVLAIVASKYGMDVTMARILLKPFGKKPKMVLLGVLIVISIFSMFMSNTATAAMFLAFLAPVFASLPDTDAKGKVGIALAIPIAANVGGIGTPIGTPPNATAVGNLDSLAQISIGFSDWAFRMIPFVIVMILFAWLLLTFFYPFKSNEIVLEIKKDDHKKTYKDYVAWITFGATILLWMTEQIHHISSNIVALIPLAVYTATGVFTKDDIKEINWDVLWLVAGGFALGYALDKTGLAKALITSIDFNAMGIVVVFVVAGLICYLLSNFISNSATAALLIPIMIAIGKGLMESGNASTFVAFGGQAGLSAFVAVCASLAMCLPISTPPNAIASATGLVETKDMTKIGLIVGIVGLVLGFFWVTKFFPFA